MRRCAPAHPGCVDEHLLGGHLHDHVRVSGDPDSLFSDLAQERIELRSVAALLDRVHPDEDTVQVEQSGADHFDRIVGVDHRLGLDAEGREGLEHAV